MAATSPLSDVRSIKCTKHVHSLLLIDLILQDQMQKQKVTVSAAKPYYPTLKKIYMSLDVYFYHLSMAL